ncbi:Son of sevenless 1 [Cymbomonas tetramitiformis]|uniref:Son of sevenless 1 n=1 Tax=Cymbomonas tetramitiformis TaxID=36881 RepID=A0AAE0FR65_9CHLO|nr:Son of sevenless 1 [Cymbomonas tetramitiformis]
MRTSGVPVISCQALRHHADGTQWHVTVLPAGAREALTREMHEERLKAFAFLWWHEITNPEFLTVIHSVRATKAVLAHQARFLTELYEGGVLNRAEWDALMSPLQRKRYLLEHASMHLKPRSLLSVLYELPFVRNISETVFTRFILQHGQTIVFDRCPPHSHPLLSYLPGPSNWIHGKAEVISRRAGRGPQRASAGRKRAGC